MLESIFSVLVHILISTSYYLTFDSNHPSGCEVVLTVVLICILW